MTKNKKELIIEKVVFGGEDYCNEKQHWKVENRKYYIYYKNFKLEKIKVKYEIKQKSICGKLSS